jgi:hypothetical protein
MTFSYPLYDKWHMADRSRRLYVKALKERLDRVESLLKAAGLVDEEHLTPPETSSDDDVSLEEDGMEAESDDDLLSSLPQNLSEHKVCMSKSANQQPGLESSSKLSGTGDSQHISIIRWDNKADSLYYGMSFIKYLAFRTSYDTDPFQDVLPHCPFYPEKGLSGSSTRPVM